MPLQTFTPPIPPSSIRKQPKVRILKAEFADGYTQATRDGMNHIRNILELSWDALTHDQAKQITDFFELHGGDQAFTYQGTKFTCEVWNDTTGRAGIHTLTATFEQSFNTAA